MQMLKYEGSDSWWIDGTHYRNDCTGMTRVKFHSVKEGDRVRE